MSTPRSYLFVPGDAPRKMDKALTAGAGALILDLEDSVAPARKAEALTAVAAFLEAQPAESTPEFWVRVNAADPTAALAELAALPLARIAGIVHPKLERQAQIERMGTWLGALEARDALPAGRTRILGIVTETADALVGEHSSSLARGHPRLRGYSWGTEDLSAVLGRPPLAGDTDAHADLARLVQRHCLLLAAAAGIDAIDGISADFRDQSALAHSCDYARELGFVAKLAIHPAQIDALDTGLAPHPDALAWARRVRAAVAEAPDAAALTVDGRMIDRPHIDVAERLLARAGEPGST